MADATARFASAKEATFAESLGGPIETGVAVSFLAEREMVVRPTARRCGIRWRSACPVKLVGSWDGRTLGLDGLVRPHQRARGPVALGGTRLGRRRIRAALRGDSHPICRPRPADEAVIWRPIALVAAVAGLHGHFPGDSPQGRRGHRVQRGCGGGGGYGSAARRQWLPACAGRGRL